MNAVTCLMYSGVEFYTRAHTHTHTHACMYAHTETQIPSLFKDKHRKWVIPDVDQNLQTSSLTL